MLGYPDSNQERQDQNLQCYHYTIAQSFALFLKSDAKVRQVTESAKQIACFFQKNYGSRSKKGEFLHFELSHNALNRKPQK